MSWPTSVAVGNDGRIFVTDIDHSRVQAYDQDGDYAATIGGPGNGPGQFNMPVGVDSGNARVQVFDEKAI